MLVLYFIYMAASCKILDVRVILCLSLTEADMLSARATVKYLLEELSRWARGPVVPRVQNIRAVYCVPLVVAGHPWQLGGERCEQIVHGPADDGVVVHPHVDVNKADGVADTCIKQTGRNHTKFGDVGLACGLLSGI